MTGWMKSIKFKLTHLQKSLIISLIIELILIVLLFQIGFKEKPAEQTYTVNFADDDFDFNELKPEEDIELPDITDALKNPVQTNRASNRLQEDKSFDEFRKQQEEKIKTFEEKRQERLKMQAEASVENSKKPDKDQKEKRFTGRSNIQYFIKNRFDVYIANPLYTCPDDMKGLVAINIEIDREGNVVSASVNKNKSTTTYECLIDSAIQAAKESFFNSDEKAPEIQKGMITYNFY